MPRRSIRLTLLSMAALLTLLWWLPALLVRLWLPGWLAPSALDLTLQGVWPKGLLGVRIQRAALTRGSETLVLEDLWMRFDGGWEAEAAVAGGHVRVRALRSLDRGLAYFRGVEIEPLVAFARRGLPIRARGRLHGAARWTDDVEISAHLREARIDVPVIGIVQLDEITTLVTAFGSGRIQLDEVIAVGPSGDLTASGAINERQELQIWLRVERLEERLLELIRELRPNLQPPPTLLEIAGSTLRPTLVEHPLPSNDIAREAVYD